MKLASKYSLAAVALFLEAVCSVLARNERSPLVLNLQRDGTPPPTSVTLYDSSTLYFADVTIGTLGQPFKLHLASDASDTWVNVANSTYCQQNLASCQSSGIYTPSSSQTYHNVSGGFSNQYTDGTGVSGAWVTDNLVIGNTTVTGLQFGVAYHSTIPVGVLGLGYVGLETYGNPSQQQYPNLPVLMYNQKLIDCIAYSLWLDKGPTDHGRLVFGGLDTGKFLGPLETLHISMDNLNYDYATITMAGLSLSYNYNKFSISDGPLQVSPDSGATAIYLPNATAYRIFSNFGAIYEDSIAWINCSYTTNATTLDFLFGSTTISVPMSELIRSYNATACYLLIQPTSASLSLGLAFLRSTYIVYDFSNNQISLAPTNPGATTDNVTGIGANGIPGGGFVGILSTPPAPANSTTPPAPTNSTSPTDLTTGAKIGIGVGVPLGIIALLGVGAFFLFGRHHQPSPQITPVSPLPTKSELYSSHRTSELETSQRFSAMSPGSFGWGHEYSPVQAGPPELNLVHEQASELEA